MMRAGLRVIGGLVPCALVAAAASLLATQCHVPAILLALVLGMLLRSLAARVLVCEGIDFAARDVLRLGVALLGLRITFGQIGSLGWQPIVVVVVSLVVTILVSIAAARALRFHALFGFLTGGATSICGVSAALALSASLPAHPAKERATLFTIIGVSALSTLAMVLYPVLARLIDLSPIATGVFFGATIHDVAQVVGAGYSVSRETGDVATIVKLLRVALLLPVILCATAITRRQGQQDDGVRPPLLPWFAVGFIALVVLNSVHWVAPTVARLGGDVSGACLLVAIGAIGMKTRWRDLAEVGLRPIALMIAEAVFLAALVLALMRILG